MIHLKDLPELEFSAERHQKIMKKIYFHKFRLPLFSIIFISAVNLLNSGWRLIVQAGEMETFSIFRSMASQFDFSFDSLTAFFQTMAENTPLSMLLTFVINTILAYSLIVVLKYIKGRTQLSALKNFNQ